MRTFLAILLAIILTTPHASVAQNATGQPSASNDPGGFWPTKKMTELFIDRWLDAVSHKYKMDNDQVAKAREDALKRWPEFIRKNRDKLQPVVNEFIEMRLEMSPPSKERVANWATEAEEALNLFKGEIDGAIEDFRGALNPLQKAKFESEVLMFSAGMAAAEAKIKQWKTGEFEEREFWDPPTSEWHRREEQERLAEEGIMPEPTDQVIEELKAWDKFVERYIEIYKLDESQQASARSALKEMKERAISYRDANEQRIAMIEKRIQEHTGSEKELDQLKKDLFEVYGPIDEMFQELKTRVEALPTDEQREAVKRGDTIDD